MGRRTFLLKIEGNIRSQKQQVYRDENCENLRVFLYSWIPPKLLGGSFGIDEAIECKCQAPKCYNRKLTNSHKAKIGVLNDEIIKCLNDENIS